MNPGLEDKVVIVTGASGGIGSAVARAFGAEGAKLVLHYRRGREAAESLRAELGAKRAVLVGGDLVLESAAARLMASALKAFGRVDTVVANAGSWETREVPLHEMPLTQWRATLNAVLTSAFLTLREFLQVVKRQRQGNAVLIGSTAGLFGEAGHADYAAAKAALAYGLMRTVKNELGRLAPHTADYCGGRINCVSPGWTVVARTRAKLGNEDVVRKVTATMALPQLGRPEDMANAVVFLASDKLARHVTGQTLVVAGGMEGRWLWRPDEVNPTIV